MQTGMGPQKAHRMATQFLQDGKWDLVVSTGFAGALQDLPIGAVVLGKDVLEKDLENHVRTSILCDVEWTTRLDKLNQSRFPFSVGRYVAVPGVLTRSEEKQQMALATGAMAVDMESGAIGKVAQEIGIPFVIVRTISDGLQEDLPLDFNLFNTPGGWVRGLWPCLWSPQAWKGLFRLYRQSREAAAQLTNFFHLFFAGVLASPSHREMARPIS